MSDRNCRYRAFSILEVTFALGLLALVMVLVAEVAVWSLQERSAVLNRQEAVEEAANILESARALSWEELTPQWAAEQKLPESLTEQLISPQLTVRVEPEANRPWVKRLTVEIQWKARGNPSVQLVGLFSARSVQKAEKKS